MERKDFLKNSLGFLGLALIAPKLTSCSNDETSQAVEATPGNGNGNGSGSNTDPSEGNKACNAWPNETEGPFPTKNPSQYQITDIKGDRSGIPYEIKIRIEDTNNDCAPVEGIIVDIWHCDKDGNYSQYGATNMQPTDYRNYNFLRGRQVTNSNGYVTFTSIFPGWYQSRATHIHVHVYKANGSSVKVTQIAYPESSNSIVVQVNAATAKGYTKGMNGYTYNAQDNVFSDDKVGQQIASVSGNINDGIVSESVIKVAL